MKRISLMVFSLFFLTYVQAQAYRTSWPMAGGDPAHSSFAKINLTFPVSVKQNIAVGQDWENGMIVTSGQLFLGDYGDPNQVIATDLETGNVQWHFDIPGTGGGMQFVPAVADTIVLAGGQGGKGLYARHVINGDSLWFQPVKSLYSRSPMITGENVYIAAGEGLFCFELSTGQQVWSYPQSIPQISPAADAQNVYFCTFDTMVAVNKFTGEVLWKNGLIPVGHFTSLSVDTSLIYVGHDTTVTSLNKFTGEVVWQTETSGDTVLNYNPSAFAMDENVLLVKLVINSADDNLYVVMDKATGQTLNSYPAAKQYAAPTIVNQYVVEFDYGTLRFLDLMSGAIVHELTSLPDINHQTQIIAANDEIYIAGNGPNVMVLKGSTTSVPVLKTSSGFRVITDPGTNDFEIHIELDKSAEVRFQLNGIDGKYVTKGNLGAWDAGFQRIPFTLDVPGGLYILTIHTDMKKMAQKIWIAQKF